MKLGDLIDDLSLLVDRKGLPIGTKRTWGSPPNDYEVVKTAHGWDPVTGQKSSKVGGPADKKPKGAVDPKANRSTAEPKTEPRKEPEEQQDLVRKAQESMSKGNFKEALEALKASFRSLGLSEADPPSSEINVGKEEDLSIVNANGKKIEAAAFRQSDTGEIVLGPDAARDLQKHDFDNPEQPTGGAIGTLMHETLHGFSPGLPASYNGVGAKIEEITTEMASRRLAYEMYGVSDPRETGAYSSIIEPSLNAVMTQLTATGLEDVSRNEANTIIHKASIRYKKRTERFERADQTFEAFVDDVATEMNKLVGKGKMINFYEFRNLLRRNLDSAEL